MIVNLTFYFIAFLGGFSLGIVLFILVGYAVVRKGKLNNLKV